MNIRSYLPTKSDRLNGVTKNLSTSTPSGTCRRVHVPGGTDSEGRMVPMRVRSPFYAPPWPDESCVSGAVLSLSADAGFGHPRFGIVQTDD